MTADAMQISSGHRICTRRNNHIQTWEVRDTMHCGDNAAPPQIKYHREINQRPVRNKKGLVKRNGEC